MVRSTMSYRNRRQSIYLKRNSILRTNSSIYEPGGSTGSRKIGDGGGPLPFPDIKSMKVYKGYEFVTFNPVDIMPPSSSSSLDQIDCSLSSSSSQDKSTIINSNNEINEKIIEASLDTEDSDWIANIGIEPVNQSEAILCLQQHIQQHCCHGSRAALEMSISDIHHSLIVRYSLESVCEKRQLCWTFEPYVNPDSPSFHHQHQTPPDDPWTIPIQQSDFDKSGIYQSFPSAAAAAAAAALPPIEEADLDDDDDQHTTIDSESESSETLQQQQQQQPEGIRLEKTMPVYSESIFQDQSMEMIVPGTISIHSCHVCAGNGRKRCAICVGSGSNKCDICEGIGFYGFDHHKSALSRTLTGGETGSDYCWRCRGRGRLRCEQCTGIGMTACAACSGSGQIKCFIKMFVNWTNHKNCVMIKERLCCEIPVDQIKMIEGDIILKKHGLNLKIKSPVFDSLIKKESSRLTELHYRKYLSNGRLINQRHQVKVIPVARVNSSWRGHRFRFYVYGPKSHRRCLVFDYPQRCCSSCCCCCCCLVM